MAEAELVSVIIPVYQTEPWLPQCLSSVRNQTYTNIEIILVDDGSTDRSGEICDRAAEEDPRIRVIHQENRGLSEARNAGMRAAKGAYLTFIDSDDYVTPDCVGFLYELLREQNADIAVGSFERVYSSGEKMEWHLPDGIVSGKEAVGLLLVNQMAPSACMRLFKRHIFAGIWFPAGKFHEDIAVIYPLMDRAERVAISGRICYEYRFREGSTVNSPFSPVHWDLVEMTERAMDYVEEKYPEWKRLCNAKRGETAMNLLRRILEYNQANEYLSYQRRLDAIIRRHALAVLRSPILSRPSKVELLLYLVSGYRLYWPTHGVVHAVWCRVKRLTAFLGKHGYVGEAK